MEWLKELCNFMDRLFTKSLMKSQQIQKKIKDVEMLRQEEEDYWEEQAMMDELEHDAEEGEFW